MTSKLETKDEAVVYGLSNVLRDRFLSAFPCSDNGTRWFDGWGEARTFCLMMRDLGCAEATSQDLKKLIKDDVSGEWRIAAPSEWSQATYGQAIRWDETERLAELQVSD